MLLRFDAADSCSDFNGHFSKFPGMKAVCRTNNGPIKKKWFCNLKCDNKYPNVWSTRPIKVIIRPPSFFSDSPKPGSGWLYLFSVKWEIWASQMKVTPGNQTRSRVLILFVMKKMIVDHSRVNTMFPINFCHGANLNQLSEQPCSTLGECSNYFRVLNHRFPGGPRHLIFSRVIVSNPGSNSISLTVG